MGHGAGNRPWPAALVAWPSRRGAPAGDQATRPRAAVAIIAAVDAPDAPLRFPLAAAACQRAHIPRITMHSDNATHRRTAMIAKDLIPTKDNNRISA
jgi:hypothetical protein